MRRRRASNFNPSALSSAMLDMRSDYQAAKRSRFRRTRSGVNSMGTSADYHYRSEADYLRMMELARDMDRNDAVVGQVVDRAVANTIQDGFSLDAQTGDDELDRELEARWEAWASDPEACDLAGEMAFADMEQLALRQMLVDGDVIFLPTVDGALQMVEAHRCRTPSGTKRNVVHGVLLDDHRRRLEYWLTKDDIDWRTPLKLVSEIRAYPVRDEDGNRQVFHIYNAKRVSQTRGVTAFAPIVDVAGMFEDINFANLVRAQVVSCFALIHERSAEWDAAGSTPQTGAQTTQVQADGSTRTIEELAPGMEMWTDPGEKIVGYSPQVPNPEFFPHVKLMLTLVGINLGLPLVMVLMDASETNFSGFRGAVDQARMGFRRNQGALIRRLHRPAYRWKVRQWISEDPAIRAAAERFGEDIFRHRWNPPTWPYIEPEKDAKADNLRLEKNLTSPRRLHAERGREWSEIAAEIVEDRALLVRRSIEVSEAINQEHPEAKVDWRELAFATIKPAAPKPDGDQTRREEEDEDA